MSINPEAMFAAAFDVSRETLDCLGAYRRLLGQWNPKINLVAQATLNDAWSRHFMDSAQLYQLSAQRGHWVDLGSGGGFPGMVIAIMSREKQDLKVTLVEADQRKAVFLRTLNRELGLSATIIAERIEELPPLDADILSARALAPLPTLLAFAERHGNSSTQALFMKGRSAEQEITQALEGWRFDCERYPSLTDEEATILSIGGIKRV